MTAAEPLALGRRPRSVAELVALVRSGALGPAPETVTVASAFLTTYGTGHAGRAQRYHNEIFSVRIGSVVGSCGSESDLPGERSAVVSDCVGATIAELLDHAVPAVRIAALDAYLMHLRPHPSAAGRPGRTVVVDGASSLAKSRCRAATVIDLLPTRGIRTVLVVGVVNSLLAELRERGMDYIPCDRAGGVTEWDEPVLRSTAEITEPYDAMLVTGMTLVNGSFDHLLEHAGRHGLPLVMFAQSGSAVLPWFLGDDAVTAISAEPYPFFSLDGGPSTHFHYHRSESTCAQ
ncbi:Rossmann-like domain-containing protein [Nocardia aurea]|uniref:Rossmann-like domain-containing protein n=1 Tax=Nocardia aurea TaxID=2144174 RepID=UPI0033AA093F